MDYISLLDLGLSFLSTFLDKSGNKLPANVIAALQAAIDAVAEHRMDVITKDNLEANRG